MQQQLMKLMLPPSWHDIPPAGTSSDHSARMPLLDKPVFSPPTHSPAPRRSTRTRLLPSHLDDYECDLPSSSLAIQSSPKLARPCASAAVYGTEECVGRMVTGALDRGLINNCDEEFVTSKLWTKDSHYDLVCLPSRKHSGVSPIVKSFNKDRMKESLQIFDWKLSDEEVSQIQQIPQARGLTGEHFVFPEGQSKSLEELWDGEI
ncbi:unnamed protein product [Fraxinus pennsylvanica]|uniref:Uncharacterized protein n=1 Tax=Fraxinus pennsylvanica TaxID=56036 RepID=A0AAD2DJW2_9LAMI|nr:unnamed protein product [Fraxinus pennsylvanica]